MGKITIVAYCGLLMTKVPDAKAFAKNFTYITYIFFVQYVNVVKSQNSDIEKG